MRNAGSGPRFAKTGKKILYRLQDVEAWLAERSFSSTAEAKLGAGEPGLGDAHQRRCDLDFRNTAQLVLRSAPHLVSKWLPDGRLFGNEWVARNPRRSDRSAGSFKVNIKTGRWADFATGDSGGDLISLLAYLRGCGQAQAARAIIEELGV